MSLYQLPGYRESSIFIIVLEVEYLIFDLYHDSINPQTHKSGCRLKWKSHRYFRLFIGSRGRPLVAR